MTWKFTLLTTKTPTANSFLSNSESLSQTPQNITFYSMWRGWQSSEAEDPQLKMCLSIHGHSHPSTLFEFQSATLLPIVHWVFTTGTSFVTIFTRQGYLQLSFHRRTDTYSWVLPVLDTQDYPDVFLKSLIHWKRNFSQWLLLTKAHLALIKITFFLTFLKVFFA